MATIQIINGFGRSLKSFIANIPLAQNSGRPLGRAPSQSSMGRNGRTLIWLETASSGEQEQGFHGEQNLVTMAARTVADHARQRSGRDLYRCRHRRAVPCEARQPDIPAYYAGPAAYPDPDPDPVPVSTSSGFSKKIPMCSKNVHRSTPRSLSSRSLDPVATPTQSRRSAIP